MEWMFLEVLVALCLLVAIVWWTLPSKRDEQRRHAPANKDSGEKDGQ
ncbi:MAG: hypothetical protein H0U63_00200 [Burkholderiales bacterium]|nr:hypothetical protein [Burkholderiales bacterium]